jgi:iron complex outermembrane recepter protein
VDLNPPINGAAEGLFFSSALARGNLNPEKIVSKEIGYLGNFPSYGLLLDAKVFDDRLTELISEKLQNADFSPSNANSAHLRGSELQLSYQPTERWLLYLAYAYLDNDASTIFEQTQYAKHSGALGISYLFPNDWRATLAYYGFGADSAGQTFYGREDLIVAKTFALGKERNLATSLVVRHFDNRSSQFLVDVGQSRESLYDHALQYFLTLQLTF